MIRGLSAFCGFRMDVKDARFVVVDPDDGVRHGLILS